MLEHTFCHLHRVGFRTEQRLWEDGCLSWEQLLREPPAWMSRKLPVLGATLEQSRQAYEQQAWEWFYKCLPTQFHWRLFPLLRHKMLYLDIETTGLDDISSITTIATYDGQTIRTYVQGQNLDEFKQDVQAAELLVTFNGKRFDVPFIQRYFGLELNHMHIDLMYVLRGLGYRGGLKNIESTLDINRYELEGVDGYFAVLFWMEYIQNANLQALETLLAYNVADVINLEQLMYFAYNKLLQQTPFFDHRQLTLPRCPPNPFKASLEVIERLRYSARY